ncbi:MAG: DUF1553 domain-containing protein [Gemmataceae bacterium]|nr:DUF1553 domain-containing protein [Gemmataceae bacterium]
MRLAIYLCAALVWNLAPVRAETPAPVSFVHEVQPILTRLGCNQGACHGAQYGQGGLKLSLRGFDEPADYREIFRGSFGRRLSTLAPEQSLLLRKPTLEAPHEGGKRLTTDSPEFETLARWISQGAPGPLAKEKVFKSLAITPSEVLAKPGQVFPLKVMAQFEDGSEESVLTRASIESMNSSVASVDSFGKVTATGPGETVIMVRFLSSVAVCRITLPFGTAKGLEPFQNGNLVDQLWASKWGKTGLTPSHLCSDEEFFRRIHLNTLSTLPTPEEIRAFLADLSPDKRRQAIEKVLSRPEYVDCWTYKWGDLLRNSRDSLQKKGMWSLHNWLRESFRENKPMDQFAGELLTAVGSPYANGPANFFVQGNRDEWTESACQVFLGIRIQCAKCHHHPFENISQGDFYGMAAFFARVAKKNSTEFGLQGRDTTVFLNATGEATHPRTGKQMPPRPLGATVEDNPIDRRLALVSWLKNPDNPSLAKNLVNRYWGYYFGRGLVHPIDDIRSTNPASNSELFDALAKDLIAHRYDIKHMLRTLMNSRVYQLSSVSNPASAGDGENIFCTHFRSKRLTAEQLLDAVDYACGTREKFTDLPLGYRAISLPDSRFASSFMDNFGRPRRVIACECERSESSNMMQALLLMSGSLLNRKVSDRNSRINRLITSKAPLPDAVDELYLCTLSRLPVAGEKQDALAEIALAQNPREGLEDLLWSLLNTREFLFNH